MCLVDIWKFFGNNSAEIIALCALLFTAYQAYLSRKHNRISVTPKLAILAARSTENGMGSFHIKLSNNGLGPAIIKRCDFEVDSKPKEFNDSDEMRTFIEDWVGPIGIKTTVMSFLPEHIIAANESSIILQLEFIVDDGKGWEHIEGIARRLSLRVKYSSMYGEQFEYHSIETHS